MTQVKQLSFPPIPAFSNWRSRAKHPDSDPTEPVAYPELTPIMATKPDLPKHKASLDQTKGLFPSESEIAKRLSQNPLEWPAKAIVLERQGFPRIDPLMGGRYWPAVEAYWHRRYGLSSMDVHLPDGKENFDAL